MGLLFRHGYTQTNSAHLQSWRVQAVAPVHGRGVVRPESTSGRRWSASRSPWWWQAWSKAGTQSSSLQQVVCVALGSFQPSWGANVVDDRVLVKRKTQVKSRFVVSGPPVPRCVLFSVCVPTLSRVPAADFEGGEASLTAQKQHRTSVKHEEYAKQLPESRRQHKSQCAGAQIIGLFYEYFRYFLNIRFAKTREKLVPQTISK